MQSFPVEEERVTLWQPSEQKHPEYGDDPLLLDYQAVEDSLFRPRTTRYKNATTLKLPCEAIFRAIGLRLSAAESKHYYPPTTTRGGEQISAFDSSRKRGVAKYFKMVLYFKGGIEDDCHFNVNYLKHCIFPCQIYENPCDSLVPPKDFNFGRLRTTLYRNPRAALMDAQQMWESFGINAPEDSASINVTSPLEFAGFVGNVPPQTRRLYKRRPESSAVTNTSFKQIFIAGTGLPLEAYHDMELHEDLEKEKMIQTLNEISAETAKEQRVLNRQLKLRFPAMHAACIPKSIEYDRPKEIGAQYSILRKEPYRRDNVVLYRYSDVDAWKRRIVGTDAMVQAGVNYPDFRVPSWGITSEFQRIIDYNNRRNVEDSQTNATDLPKDPIVQNYAMVGKTKDTYDLKKLESVRRIKEMRFQPQDVLDRFYQMQISKPLLRFPAIYGEGI